MHCAKAKRPLHESWSTTATIKISLAMKKTALNYQSGFLICAWHCRKNWI